MCYGLSIFCAYAVIRAAHALRPITSQTFLRLGLFAVWQLPQSIILSSLKLRSSLPVRGFCWELALIDASIMTSNWPGAYLFGHWTAAM